jgi:transcription-repair coupling factor (superfamily II helicase)
LRWIAKDLGFEKVILKADKMIAYFVANPQSNFFESPSFGHILNFIKQNPKACQMKERNNKLSLVFEKIDGVEKALKQLEQLRRYRLNYLAKMGCIPNSLSIL